MARCLCCKTLCDREMEGKTKCAGVCIAVNIARELSYASKAAPAIWPPRLHHLPPLSPHLLLTLSFSLLHTLTHMLGLRDCPCVPLRICVYLRGSVCVGGVLAAASRRV